MTVDQLFWWLDQLEAEMLPDSNLDATRTALLSEATVAAFATTPRQDGYDLLEQIRQGTSIGELVGCRLEPQPDSTMWVLTIPHPLKHRARSRAADEGRAEEDAIVAAWKAAQVKQAGEV